MFRGLFIFIGAILVSLSSLAAKRLPSLLTEADRHTAAQVLGFGSAMKLLSNPYPLGGYSGLEIGISSEYIPLDNIGSLGTHDGDKGEYNFYTLSIGKGLFYNIDTFLQFTPMPQTEGLTSYAGQLRWGFFEATNFPFTLSAILFGSGGSFTNVINTNNFGLDLVAVINMRDVALYFGGGRVRGITNFVGGGTANLTDDGQSHDVDLLENHAVFGVNIKLSQFFLALEVDRYAESTYSGKLGTRF